MARAKAALLAAGFTAGVAAQGIVAQVTLAPGPAGLVPEFPGGRPPAGLVAPPWGCGPRQRDCVGPGELRLILERQKRFELLRQDPAGAQPVPAFGLWRVPQTRYLPPPTPETEIQPAFRDSSLVRPEFKDSGTPLR